MECSCQFASQSNFSGSYVSALIKISTKTDRTAFGHVSGFLQVDSRWMKSNNNMIPKLSDIFVKRANKPMDGIAKIPRTLPGGNNTFCIFVTPKTQLIGTLCLIQFDLPHDTLPSFKGLLASITYFVTIVVTPGSSINEEGEEIHGEPQTYHFPFNVSGPGSYAKPQYIRSSSLIAEPLSSFPAEHVFMPSVAGSVSSSNANAADVMRRERNQHSRSNSTESEEAIAILPSNPNNKSNVNAYTVRDEGLVCVVTCPSSLNPGDILNIIVSFENSEQTCKAIRTKLVMREMRAYDGSMIQEKVIASSQRMTKDALIIHFSMRISADCPCSFYTPLFNVKYRLDFDFFDDNTQSHCDDVNEEDDVYENNHSTNPNDDPNGINEVFTWSLDFTVTPRLADITNRANLLNCLEPSTFCLRQLS